VRWPVQLMQSEGATSSSVPWSSVGEFAKQKYVKKEPEGERIKDEVL
jgi:hypothetical protein